MRDNNSYNWNILSGRRRHTYLQEIQEAHKVGQKRSPSGEFLCDGSIINTIIICIYYFILELIFLTLREETNILGRKI